MGSFNLRPSSDLRLDAGTIVSGVVAGTGAAAVLRDENVGTFITTRETGERILAQVTLAVEGSAPAGSRIVSVTGIMSASRYPEVGNPAALAVLRLFYWIPGTATPPRALLVGQALAAFNVPTTYNLGAWVPVGGDAAAGMGILPALFADMVQTQADGTTRPITAWPNFHGVRFVVSYQEQPTVVTTGPTGVVSNPRPVVTWTYDAHPDGRAQEFYRLQVIRAADYPSGLPLIDTLTIYSGEARATVPVPLGNGDYYSRVSAGSVLNGAGHWSDFSAWVPFTVTTAPPSAPTSVVATPVDGQGHIRVAITMPASGPGVTDADGWQIQRSGDGGVTWYSPAGGIVGVYDPATGLVDGYGLGVGRPVYWNDWETAPGEQACYRVRGFAYEPTPSPHNTWGAWTTSADVAWNVEGCTAWLKAPGNPQANHAFELMAGSFEDTTSPDDRGLFTVPGRRRPIVISSVRKAEETTIVLGALGESANAARLAMEALMAPGTPVVVQADEVEWRSRWVSVGAVSKRRIIPDVRKPDRVFELPVVEIDPTPTGTAYTRTLMPQAQADDPASVDTGQVTVPQTARHDGDLHLRGQWTQAYDATLPA